MVLRTGAHPEIESNMRHVLAFALGGLIAVGIPQPPVLAQGTTPPARPAARDPMQEGLPLRPTRTLTFSTDVGHWMSVDVSPDGNTLAFEERTALGNYDVLTLSLSTAGPAAVLLGSRFDELALRFSPDGRAVVFMSDESGRYEVYAAPFPAPTQKMRVSTGDAGLGWGRTRARRPHWSPTGREIFYLAGDRHVVSVPVRTEPLLELGTPAILFSLPERSTWVDFAVSADGKRFLSIVSDVRGSEQPLTVVLNWPAERDAR